MWDSIIVAGGSGSIVAVDGVGQKVMLVIDA